jgi:hypothetical protein
LEKKYWLHRISYHSEVSYDLLNLGYLTIGWSIFSNENIAEIVEDGKDSRPFINLMEKNNIYEKSRRSLWYFALMKAGDIVVVPMYYSRFGIYRITKPIQSIKNLPISSFIASNNHKYELKGGEIVEALDGGDSVDLGFFLEVEAITKKPIPRNFAESNLVKRMKIRQTNADISDLKDSVENAALATKPHDVYSVFIDQVQNKFIKDNIFGKYRDEDIEKIVANYFTKLGADEVIIPAKNDPKKKEGSDADVIAEFKDLKTTYYVQVKHHEGLTDAFGFYQIKNYVEYIESISDEKDEVAIGRLLTTARFSDEVEEKAENLRENSDTKIRLIDGGEFIKMIINAGIDLLDINKLK